jgi:hypothetical protein
MPADNVGFERQAKQIRNKKRADRHRGYKKKLINRRNDIYRDREWAGKQRNGMLADQQYGDMKGRWRTGGSPDE